jgi:YceI-like domain
MKLISFLLIFISLTVYPKTIVKNMEINEGGSSLNIYGDSSLKKWETKALKFSGKGSFKVEGNILKKINSFTLDLDSKDIKSGSDTMDEHTATALEIEKFPKITGMIKESAISENKVTGTIEFDLHGVKKVLPFTSTINLSHEKLTVEGEQFLNISDFGIIPPTTKILFFSATAKPEINIKYKFELEAK